MEIAACVEGCEKPFPAAFIRAPQVTEIDDGVEVLAEHDRQIVTVRDGPVVGTALHPELAGVSRIHDLVFFESSDR